MRAMLFDLFAGVVLLVGCAACVASVVVVRRYRPAWLLVAAGLACAAATEFLEAGWESAGNGGGRAHHRGPRVAGRQAALRRDPAVAAGRGDGRVATGALAVALGAGAATAVAAGGVVGVMALSRWRPGSPLSWRSPGSRARRRRGAGAAWRPRCSARRLAPARRVEPGPEFSPVVLGGAPRVRDDRARRC